MDTYMYTGGVIKSTLLGLRTARCVTQRLFNSAYSGSNRQNGVFKDRLCVSEVCIKYHNEYTEASAISSVILS